MDAVVASASDKKKKTGFGTRDGKGKGKAKEGGGESDEAGPADDDGGGEIEPASPPKATTPNRRTQRRNRAKAAAGNSPSPKKGGGDGRGEDAGGDGDNNADEGGGAPATKEGPVLNDVPSKQCPACTTRINIRVCTCVPTPPRVGGFLFNPFFLSVILCLKIISFPLSLFTSHLHRNVTKSGSTIHTMTYHRTRVQNLVSWCRLQGRLKRHL